MTGGWNQHVNQWCETMGMDVDLAWVRLRGQPEFETAHGHYEAKELCPLVDEWLLLAAQRAGLFERR